MKYLHSFWFLSVLCLCNTIVFAEVHTWHSVQSLNGHWQAGLQMINQKGSFVAKDGHEINAFTIDSQHPFQFGFKLDRGATFDVAYTLTLIQRQSDYRMFESKACVYVITAKGPAQPDIKPLSYHGAKCDWRVQKGVGEDFIVS